MIKIKKHLKWTQTKKIQYMRNLIIMLFFTLCCCAFFILGLFFNKTSINTNKNKNIDFANAASIATQTVTTAPTEIIETTTSTTEKIVQLNQTLVLYDLTKNLKAEETEYKYSNSYKFNKNAKIKGIEVPLTKTSFNLEYKGIINANIDSSLIEVAVDNYKQEITVLLPTPKITNHNVLSESLSIKNKEESIINPVSEKDYEKIFSDQNPIMENKAIEDGIYDEVIQKYKTAIVNELNKNIDIKEYFQIKFIILD